MKVSVLIAEDEEHARERLRDLLKDFPELQVVGEAGDGAEAVRLIDALRPRLVFLDIQMPEATGFEVLERIKHQPRVVFVTAYDHYAIKAFDENAVDYVLKPFSRERIGESIRRVLETERDNVVDMRLLEKLKEAVRGNDYMQRFAASVGDEILIIPQEEVFYFQAEDKVVFLYTDRKRYIIDITLRELEDRLDPAVFLRIHKSTIAALDKVRKIKKWFRGEILVQLSDAGKTKLKVSRGSRQSLKEKLQF